MIKNHGRYSPGEMPSTKNSAVANGLLNRFPIRTPGQLAPSYTTIACWCVTNTQAQTHPENPHGFEHDVRDLGSRDWSGFLVLGVCVLPVVQDIVTGAGGGLGRREEGGGRE